MNGCGAVQARFTEYLDGRLNGREMQRIASHLNDCRECGREWTWLRKTQSLLAELGPVSEPEDLLLRIRVAVSQERARRRQSRFHALNMAWKNTVGPFLLQAGAGFASSVVLLGTVILLVTMFAQPESAQASKDEPLGNPTAPRLVSLSTDAGNNQMGDLSGPVVVEVRVNDQGHVYDYRIVSGPTDEVTKSQIENMLLNSIFEPARFFGQPVRGLEVLSFSGVSVRG
jgi:negative regulator of sigma E activity